ncbi:MAG TPA: hypothetical protein VF928_15175 [Usitatibacteraceae bacterium]
MRFSKKSARLLLISIFIFVAGCASEPRQLTQAELEDPNRSIVFGYFDMQDASTKLDEVSIKQYSSSPLYFSAGIKDGMFFRFYLLPGSYQVDTFTGASGIFGGDTTRYHYGSEGRNDTAIHIQKPGVYFLGAYRYVKHDQGWFKNDKFEMKPIQSPSERELLQKLIVIVEGYGNSVPTRMKLDMLKKRLAELRN